MREKEGDRGTVVTVTRNQEQINMESEDLNLDSNSEELNVILETKRK